jgi:hypothetical protein
MQTRLTIILAGLASLAAAGMALAAEPPRRLPAPMRRGRCRARCRTCPRRLA